jgi:fumarylacetoacetase
MTTGHIIDPNARSWVEVPADSDFPIQNLPYGIFRAGGRPPAVGVAIGRHILDLAAVHEAGLFAGTSVALDNVFARNRLNDFMGRGPATWREVRGRVAMLLRADNGELRDNAPLRSRALIAQSDAEMMMPVQIGDYIDFYTSRDHATRVGLMFRGPNEPLPANFLWMPIGYHGRTASFAVSPAAVRRPHGQIKHDLKDPPTFGVSRKLDFELEIGIFVGVGNREGMPIAIDHAYEHLFGAVLLNDWSARDIQQWESVPLGPHLGKSFGTLISPWVVPFDALEPFHVAGPSHDFPEFDYLRESAPGAFDIHLEAFIQTAAMKAPARVCATNLRHLYWTVAQMIAHGSINGARFNTGDIFGSGTISGPGEGSAGCMLESTLNGTKPLELPGGEKRGYLEDGDRVVFRGRAQGQGYRIGFGECSGTVLPPLDLDRW